MQSQISLERSGHRFILCQEKAAYWENEKSLLLSDVHAGKAALFRSNGIPLSSDHLIADLLAIEALIQRFGAERLIILGDLFHSDHNQENALAVDWLNNLSIDVLLIEGNHDVHTADKKYRINSLEELKKDGIHLLHEPSETQGHFQINGHLHPAYRIRGKAKQSLKFPCFYVNNERLILPAFGQLTGNKVMKKGKGDQMIIISPEGLMAL